MPRKKSNPVELVPDMPVNEDAINAVQNLGAIAQGLQDERDLVNQLLGQVQMANAIARFSDVVSLSKLQYIKENKLYRALKGKKAFAPDGTEISDVGTFEGFCQALGISYSKVHEDLTNLKAFGEDALKQLGAIGAGYRELRQWRSLPEDQKAALIEVAATGDKDSFIELAEQLIAKHAKEKEELVKQKQDAEGELEAARAVCGSVRDESDKLAIELAKLKNQRNKLTPPERAKDLRRAIADDGLCLEVNLLGTLREACRTLREDTEESGIDHAAFLGGIVRSLELTLQNVRDEFGLPTDSDFAWMREATLAPLGGKKEGGSHA